MEFNNVVQKCVSNGCSRVWMFDGKKMTVFYQSIHNDKDHRITIRRGKALNGIH
jgi:hypothetical protein